MAGDVSPVAMFKKCLGVSHSVSLQVTRSHIDLSEDTKISQILGKKLPIETGLGSITL